jgi:carboxyl-terminal processing protease
MRRTFLLALGVALLSGAFVLGFVLAGSPHRSSGTLAPSAVDEVRAELAARYYRPVSSDVLQKASIRSMLAALNDPYTSYLSPPAYMLLRQETAASYSGIGVSVLPGSGGLLVVATQPGPARAAGIRTGDLITTIDGHRTAQLGLAHALTRIMGGPLGSPVSLRVAREGRSLGYIVHRERLRAPTVRGRLLSLDGRRYGYVHMSAFRAGVAQVLETEIRRLERSGAGGLVLDLRENPGGLLEQAVSVASLFLQKGTVVSLEGAHQPREVYSVSGGAFAPRLPLAVLIDRYSASSAEILAAALRDHRRATLVGEHTYGKAVVQSIDPLRNGAALELTTASYFTPAGIDISRIGVRPDVRVADNPKTAIDEVVAAGVATLAAKQS